MSGEVGASFPLRVRAAQAAALDRAQQQRVIAGFLLGRANDVRRGGWRDRYANSAALLKAISALLDEQLPRRGDGEELRERRSRKGD